VQENEVTLPPRPRRSRKTTKFHKAVRQIHLYTGLFLLPLILVYASSAFVLNHRHMFDAHIKSAQEFKPHSEHPFTPGESFPEDDKGQARAILQAVDLDGPHNIQGKPTEYNITVNRPSGGGYYRVKWLKEKDKIVVERRPFSIVSLLNYLHFTAGYSKSYLRRTAWAAVVDFVALCFWIWGISGVLMWLRMPRRIPWGIAAVAAGWLLFALLAAALFS
jgi:hypothetical protein